MRLYPDLPVRRANTAVLDAATLVSIVVFALLGLWVHSEVSKLDILGRGVRDAGSAVESGFNSAADAVHGTPLVGGAIAGGLRDAGSGTGGPAVDAGNRGIRRVHRVATLLGLLVFGLPTAMLLSRFLPSRLDQVRKLTAASRVLRDGDETRRRLVAERAAFALPYGVLLRYTPDPIGDLAAGRHDALIAAALEEAGLRRAS